MRPLRMGVSLMLCLVVQSSGSPATGWNVVGHDAPSTVSGSQTVTARESMTVSSQEAVFSTVLEPREDGTQRAVAEQLAGASGRSISWVQDRLRNLRKGSGSGVYVQIDGHSGPLEILFRPTAGGAATLLRGVERSPSMRVERDVRDHSVVLFRIGRSDTSPYEFSVPTYITSATVVVNGRLVTESRALSTEEAITVRVAAEEADPEEDDNPRPEAR